MTTKDNHEFEFDENMPVLTSAPPIFPYKCKWCGLRVSRSDSLTEGKVFYKGNVMNEDDLPLCDEKK